MNGALDRRWASRQVAEGRLTPIRIGGRSFINPDELDGLIADGIGAPHVRGRKRAS